AWREEWTGVALVLLTDMYRVAARNGCPPQIFHAATGDGAWHKTRLIDESSTLSTSTRRCSSWASSAPFARRFSHWQSASCSPYRLLRTGRPKQRWVSSCGNAGTLTCFSDRWLC